MTGACRLESSLIAHNAAIAACDSDTGFLSCGRWEAWGGKADIVYCVFSEVSMTAASGSVLCFSWIASNMSSCGATSSPILPLSMRVANAGNGKWHCNCSQTWRCSEFLRTSSPMARHPVQHGYLRNVCASFQSPQVHDPAPQKCPLSPKPRSSRFWPHFPKLPSGAKPLPCWDTWTLRLCR